MIDPVQVNLSVIFFDGGQFECNCKYPFGSKTNNQHRTEINNDKKEESGVGFLIKKATSLKTQPAKE